MLVRIRWDRREKGTLLRRQGVASALAALLAPSALIAFTISFWSIAANFHWTSNFFVSKGLFSHWEVWLMAAAGLLAAARLLNR